MYVATSTRKNLADFQDVADEPFYGMIDSVRRHSGYRRGTTPSPPPPARNLFSCFRRAKSFHFHRQNCTKSKSGLPRGSAPSRDPIVLGSWIPSLEDPPHQQNSQLLFSANFALSLYIKQTRTHRVTATRTTIPWAQRNDIDCNANLECGHNKHVSLVESSSAEPCFHSFVADIVLQEPGADLPGHHQLLFRQPGQLLASSPPRRPSVGGSLRAGRVTQ